MSRVADAVQVEARKSGTGDPDDSREPSGVAPDHGGEPPLPEAVSLMALAEKPADPAKTLLGDRYLCVGAGMLFIGPSGIGKSSASVQQDILWALGCEAFGIRPARPLRILTIQAENDGGDLYEMARGVIERLELTNDDRQEIRDRVLYVSECAHAGADFLSIVGRLLEKYRPNILRLDPLFAYLGADVNDQKETAFFLRSGLNPLLEKYQCGAIINHHTPKTTNRDTTNWRASDWGYAGAGSNDVTNWARAALVIDPTHAGGIFKFIAAKRGGRIGWRDEAGVPIRERFFCHDTNGGICWREATPEDIEGAAAAKPGRKGADKTKEDLKALVPAVGATPKTALLSHAQNVGIGEKRARGFLAELLTAEDLYEWRIPRPKTNPEIRISRHKELIV